MPSTLTASMSTRMNLKLTDDELKWGQAFWTQFWRAGKGEEEAAAAHRRQAWAQLAQRFGAAAPGLPDAERQPWRPAAGDYW